MYRELRNINYVNWFFAIFMQLLQ